MFLEAILLQTVPSGSAWEIMGCHVHSSEADCSGRALGGIYTVEPGGGGLGHGTGRGPTASRALPRQGPGEG